MADRIKRQPDKLRDQLIQASAAATAAGAAWPAGAPTPAQLAAGAAAIDTRITSTNNLGASLRIEEKAKATATTAGIALMKEVDEETDALYGADGPEKLNFGLTPKAARVAARRHCTSSSKSARSTARRPPRSCSTGRPFRGRATS